MSLLADILARVQSFLPQIQRANAASLETDVQLANGFELINQDTAELDAEAEADERKLQDEQEQDGELDPQIVMVGQTAAIRIAMRHELKACEYQDLALGVLEEKHSSSGSDDEDLDDDQDEDSEASEESDENDGSDGEVDDEELVGEEEAAEDGRSDSFDGRSIDLRERSKPRWKASDRSSEEARPRLRGNALIQEMS